MDVQLAPEPVHEYGLRQHVYCARKVLALDTQQSLRIQQRDHALAQLHVTAEGHGVPQVEGAATQVTQTQVG